MLSRCLPPRPQADITRVAQRVTFSSLLVALFLFFSGPAPEAQTPSEVGQWSSVQTLPTEAVHAHMLPTGKVLFWAYSDDARFWDPATGAITLAQLAGFNTFCAGHSTLPDGRLLVTGGHIANEVGLPRAAVFDPFTNLWSDVPDMNAGRWYPTNVTLGNGDILTISGSLDTIVGENTLPQVWDHVQNQWRDLVSARLAIGNYPFMHLAPDGRVFLAGYLARTMYLDTSGNGSWTDVALNTVHDAGSSVMYDEGK